MLLLLVCIALAGLSVVLGFVLTVLAMLVQALIALLQIIGMALLCYGLVRWWTERTK
jgi:hypothetical protein